MVDDYQRYTTGEAEARSAISWLLVTMTSLLALLSSIWPLPVWAVWIRPEVVLMMVVYWIIRAPFRFGIVYAWLMGLSLDLLTGSVLCQHALGLTFVAYIAFLFHQRISMFSVIQQAIVIFILVVLFELINFWIYGLTGGVSSNVAFLIPAIPSALLWPLISITLDRLLE